MRRVLLSLLLVGFLAPALYADIVICNDGRRFEGDVTQEGGVVMIKTRYGKVTIQADEVARIVPKVSPRDEYKDKLAALKLDTAKWESAAEHYKLGVWCEKNRLRREAKERFERAVALDPDHREAHEALGHVMYLGKWVPLEVKMRAEGKVYSGGKWIPKEEAQKKGPNVARSRPARSARVSGGALTAATGTVASSESKWVSCTKCGGDGIILSRDCLQCGGKGMCRTGAGYSICNHCRGSGKENFVCPACGATGKHLRGRYTFPMPKQAKLGHSGRMHCPKCNGTGYAEILDCYKCKGKGVLHGMAGFYVCYKCQGTGKIAFRCPWCGGMGVVNKR